MGRIPGTIAMLRSLGFAETEGGSLVMPLETDQQDLLARKLEIETGIGILRQRIEQDQKTEHDRDIVERLKTNADTAAATKQLSKTSGLKASSTKTKDNKTLSSTTNTITAGTDKTTSLGTELDSTSKKKDLAQIEKMKRIKAEVELQQHKTAMQELQSQLFDLKEAEHKQLNYRYEATINRLEGDEKVRVQRQVTAIGKQTTALQLSPVDTTGTKLKSKTTTISTSSPVKDRGSELNTTLIKPVKMGDTRLPVATQEGFKKGMKLLIGTGTNMEIRTLTGFGSLLIDKELSYNHPIGTIIVGVIPSSKNLIKLEKRFIQEFCMGILYEELIPAAVVAGEETALALQLNMLYNSRPVIKHTYTMQSLAPVKLGEGSCKGLAFADSTKLYATLGNQLQCFDFKLCATELIGLFDTLADTLAVVSNSTSDLTAATIDAMEVNKTDLLNRIDASTGLRGSFHLIQDAQHASSLSELLDRCVTSGSDRISWKSYFKLVSGRSLQRSASLSLQQLGYQGNLDDISFTLLLKMFDFYDCDEDEAVTDRECQHTFAELDGCVPESTVFDEVLSSVVGGGGESGAKLSLKEFLLVRDLYAQKVNTLSAGMLLHGACQVYQTVETLLGGDPSSLPTSTLSPCELWRALPSSMQYMKHLPSNTTLALALETDLHKRNCTNICDIFNNERRLCCGSVHITPIGSNTTNIIQVQLDSTGRMVYALSDNGTIHVYDTIHERKLFEQRVMWAEPLSGRSVEGNERFAKWRTDSGLEHDDSTADMHLNSIEVTRISSLLSRFALTLPPSSGSLTSLAVDPVSGLVAVNCSIVSGSICLFEPGSLKRIFRIKSPAKFTSQIKDAIQGLTFGKLPKMEVFHKQSCAGALTAMAVNSQKSVILCQLAEQHSISILSLLTGDIVLELSGHTDVISCFTLHSKSDFLFTGSEDRSVRVWKTTECIPSRLAVTGTASTTGTRKLEHNITHSSTVGTGSMKLLRNVFTHLCARLRVQPRWRKGVIVSFYDGHKYSTETSAAQLLAGVEVVFEDSTTQLFANPTSLREVTEIERAPHGPPLWSERAVIPSVGHWFWFLISTNLLKS